MPIRSARRATNWRRISTSMRDLLRRAPNLLIVSSNGAGYDPVDVEACTAAGVLVVNQSGGNAHSVAEHALGMLLTLSKRIIEADRALRRDRDVNRNALMGNEVQGKTIGIVGLGNVGRRIAELCKGLLAHEGAGLRSLSLGRRDRRRGAARRSSSTSCCAAPIIVSINCPLTKDSRGMIGAQQFALMQPHAYFITTARGFIHDEDALLRGAARQAHRRRRPRRLGQGAAAAGSSAAAVRQRAGEPAHRRRHQGGAREHGPDRRRADARRARRQAAAAHHQSRGLAALRRALRARLSARRRNSRSEGENSSSAAFAEATKLLPQAVRAVGTLLSSAASRRTPRQRPFSLLRDPFRGVEGYFNGTGPFIASLDAVADQPWNRALCRDRGREPA